MEKRLHIWAKNTTDLLPNERVLHAASPGGVDSPPQGERITVGIVNRIAPQNAMCKRWDTLIFLLKAYTMMFSYHQVKERPKLLLAMTGLNHAEFAQLLPHFQSALDQYVQHNYIDRDNRQRQYGGGQPESTLVNVEDKLLFISYYFKVYPLQDILPFQFDMMQSPANEWMHILSGVLHKALDHGRDVPERDPQQLETDL